jgi:hypothetical protein
MVKNIGLFNDLRHQHENRKNNLRISKKITIEWFTHSAQQKQ